MIVYVIKSKQSGKIYIGYTNDLRVRMKRHNGDLPNKKSAYTSKNKGPWFVIYKERCDDRKSAIFREKELKSAKGREFIKKFINTPC